MVVEKGGLAGLFAGTPEQAWDEASELSRKLHITYKQTPLPHRPALRAGDVRRALGRRESACTSSSPCWRTAGELIIYAPHIHEISVVHGKLIEEIGYHRRDYFLGQWDRFKHYPWGAIAHSTHVPGYRHLRERGREDAARRVTLATGIPKEVRERINMGYRDPASIIPADYADREEEGILHVPKAGGDALLSWKIPAAWAAGVA